jgi:hypothetical protein
MPKKDTDATAAAPTTRAKRVRRAVKPAAARRRTAVAPVTHVTHEQIALRAYELHLAGTEGDALAHWLRAERELVTA